MRLESYKTNIPERSLFGIKLEDPAFDRVEFTYLLLGGTCARLFRRIRIENGSVIPKEGAALIVVAPHTSFWDPPMVYYAVATQARRSMRMIAADYVVDPHLPQDPKELEKTGKKPHPRWKRHVVSWCAGIGYPISYNRSDNGREAQEEIDQTVNKGELVAIALQETRKKPSEPNPARIGAARIALRYPDLQVIPMGIIGMDRIFGPITVRIGDSFTAKEILDREGLGINDIRSVIEVHNSIALATSTLLPEEVAKNLLVRGKDLRKNTR